MTHKDITNYEELQLYIKTQLHNQITTKKKTAEIKLDRIWFFKTISLIQFILKHSESEKDAKRPIDRNWTYFKVTCNGYKTKFVIYDL